MGARRVVWTEEMIATVRENAGVLTPASIAGLLRIRRRKARAAQEHAVEVVSRLKAECDGYDDPGADYGSGRPAWTHYRGAARVALSTGGANG